MVIVLNGMLRPSEIEPTYPTTSDNCYVPPGPRETVGLYGIAGWFSNYDTYPNGEYAVGFGGPFKVYGQNGFLEGMLVDLGRVPRVAYIIGIYEYARFALEKIYMDSNFVAYRKPIYYEFDRSGDIWVGRYAYINGSGNKISGRSECTTSLINGDAFDIVGVVNRPRGNAEYLPQRFHPYR